MPTKAGRLTGMEREFVRHMARTHDQSYAAAKAGYAVPKNAGWKLMSNELIQIAVRSEVEKALKEKLGPAAVYNLAEIALDKAQPAGARVKASEILMKAAGLGAQEGDSGKELHEMTGDELRREIARMEAHQQAMQRALADQARPIVDASPIEEDSPKSDVFG